MKKLMNSLWNGFKQWSYQWFGGLIMEKKEDGKMALSLGRTLLLCVMCAMGAVWWKAWQGMTINMDALLAAIGESKNAVQTATKIVEALQGTPVAEMPAGMMEVFYALSGYVFGTKFTDALKKKWAK